MRQSLKGTGQPGTLQEAPMGILELRSLAC